MLYFKKCRPNDTENKVSNHNNVRTEAHKLLRFALAQNGIPECEQKFIYNKYGKPSLKENSGLDFNISHCRELAVCAVAKAPIGVDAEKIRDFSERVMRRCFTEPESDYVKSNSSPNKAFFQLWTLKESYIKAIGIGLSYPLSKASFIINNNNIIANTEDEFSFMQIIIDNEFICSACSKNIFDNKVYYKSYEDKVAFETLTH